jgi:hypothetical protein
MTAVVLDEVGKVAFQKYLNSGGNFIGIHAASDCLRNTTFYGNETGDKPFLLTSNIAHVVYQVLSLTTIL